MSRLADLTVIVAVGTYGDVLPFVALGRALQARGQMVMLLSNLDHQALARRHGLDFAAIAPPHPPQDGPSASDAFHELAMPCFAASFTAISALARTRVVRIVAHDLAIGAISAAQAHRLACIAVVLSPCGLAATRLPQEGSAPATAAARAEQLAVDAFRGARGLPPLSLTDGAEFLPVDKVIALYSRHFAPLDASTSGVVLAGFAFASEAIGLDEDLRCFLDKGPPPVVFTPGTGVREVEGFFDMARRVCESLGLRGIFLSPAAPALADPDIVARDFVALDALMSQTRLIVHHGGIGTLAQALRAGIPQVIIPSRFDQPDNARRVADLSVGVVVTQPPDPDRLAAAIARADEDPRYRTTARTLGQRLAEEHGLETAAEAICAAFEPWRAFA